ncbi:MAG: acyl-CoA thioesterase [Ignavibacteriales bacterium]|nr:acyl-CoA thioesterase [Ignavibacteriota bacterium]MCB9247196.1 acyl-CoA thioesterase [Ignavibacteriales bacterium]
MLQNTTSIRVRYADTDKMQFVYNGKYLEYFEVGRTELLRSCGLAYSELEKAGYQLPLIEAGVKYKSPAYYDDVLEITASINEINSAKVYIEYSIKKENADEIIVTGFTSHMFIREETKRPTKPPQIYIDALKKYFQ